jgi:hypothetical protein
VVRRRPWGRATARGAHPPPRPGPERAASQPNAADSRSSSHHPVWYNRNAILTPLALYIYLCYGVEMTLTAAAAGGCTAASARRRRSFCACPGRKPFSMVKRGLVTFRNSK